MPRDQIAILLNPSAGQGGALARKTKLEQTLQRLDVAYDLFVTESKADLRRQTRIHAGRYPAIAGAGGDSTFHIMVNEIMEAGLDTSFGMIGLGSSNDIVREFGLLSLDAACAALKKRRQRSIDLGGIFQSGGLTRYFLGQANIGLGVSVNRSVAVYAEKKKLLSRNQTFAGTLGIINAYRSKEIPLNLTIETDGATFSDFLNLAVFSNTRYWASGKGITPEASPTDGRLDACLIRKCSFFHLVRLAYLARKNNHTADDDVTILQSQRFKITSETAFEVQADGEILGEHRQPDKFKTIEFKIVPSALNIIVNEEDR